MDSLVLSALDYSDDSVEFVERKGLGHPDTICDALAETFSRNLCREYRSRFEETLHYNVDKALLCGGRAAAAFGGGHVIAPINIYFAGRATSKVGNDHIPISEIAIEGSRDWLSANMHALDVEQDVRFHVVTEPGSLDLQTLFLRRGENKVCLANDSVIAVGYAPLSSLEQLVLAIEKRINGRNRHQVTPAWGEDVKVMAVRRGNSVQLTIACAMIGRYLADLDDYLAQKAAIEELAREKATELGFRTCDVVVNNADDVSRGDVYLTVTGTSAEAGDDGQVGRGNRANGLITPCRPMSLEALAGKNPVTHAGKIYNVTAREIAEKLVAEMPVITAAQCLMASRIGSPISSPALIQVKLATKSVPVPQLRERVEEVIADHLAHLPLLVDDFVAGKIDIF